MTATGVQYGSADVAYDNEILRTVVGSGVHGIAIEGTDDHDEMGVFIEPPEIVLGFGPPMDHFIWRTQPEGHRSGPGDTDRVIYSLRKFLRLAIKGNPTVLLPLFCPDESVLIGTPLGGELRGLGRAFLSRQAVRRFLGYMEGQRERMTTGKRVPNRPELVEKYGYDVKYAAHALRLSMQGYVLAVEGELTVPLRDSHRDSVLEVKRGEVPRQLVIEKIRYYEEATQRRLPFSPLPEEPDVEAVTEWSVQAHQRWWETK